MKGKTLLILAAAYYFFFREKETTVIVDENQGTPGFPKVPGEEAQQFQPGAQSPLYPITQNPESL